MNSTLWVLISSVLAAVVPVFTGNTDPRLQTAGGILAAVFAGLRVWQKKASPAPPEAK